MKGRFSIILFLFLFSALFAQEDVRIISSTSSSIVVEYKPIYIDTSVIRDNNQSFVKVNLRNGLSLNISEYGFPDLPHREVNIGVPSEIGNTIRILDADFTTLSGLLSPVPNIIDIDGNDKFNYEINDGYYNSVEFDLVGFGEFGYIREMPVQTIKINPVQFDPASHSIKLYKRILFQVNFGPTLQPTQIVKNELLKNIILNYNVAKKWGKQSSRLQKISASQLADGTWYRFEAPTEGIYKIDRSMLSAYGIDAASVDPRTIKIFNNGGYQLPEEPNAARPVHLMEIAVKIVGEEDGSFDANDYILFYGRGTDFWEYNQDEQKIIRYKNHFTNKNYFWITSGGQQGKRIQNKVSLNESNKFAQSSTPAFHLIEIDLVNIGHSGRDYWGDEFSTNTSSSRTYITSLGGIIPGSTINYNFRLANASSSGYPIRVYENNLQIYSSTMFGYGSSKYIYAFQHIGEASFSGSLPEDRSTLKFNLSMSAADHKAYLDFIEIKYTKSLRASNDSLIFYSYDTTATTEFSLSNFSNSMISVFDITDFANVKTITNAFVSGGQFIFQANKSNGTLNKYIAVTNSVFKAPINPVLIENSDIMNIQPGTEFVIITHKNFRDYAEELRNYRTNESASPISTSVFYIDEIYNEFSCGMQDPTAIRDFLKYCYDNWTVKPFYVLFFGGGTYDYLDTQGIGNNFIPTYQTEESLNEINSFPTDDYYARISGDDKKVDLALGRLPVQTIDDAEAIINKIKKYEQDSEKSLWRNKITLVADDGWTPTDDNGNLHTRQSENLSNNVIPSYFIQDKIYLAAYPAVMTGLGRKKPEVNTAIIDAINNGTLILNYVGHGSPKVWADEDVFEKTTSIPMLRNDKYLFLTAATCDFGKFDDPSEPSSTQLMLFLPDAGTIGSFTAARLVYSSSNAILNDSLYTNLFRRGDNPNLPVRLGAAYFATKQNRTTPNDEKYYLFCDPTLRLNEPHIPVSIDSVNGSTLTTSVQINALGKVEIKGSVPNEEGELNNFNGEGIISVFDSKRSVDLPEINYSMTAQGGVIFKGRVSINNGNFSADFTVPKDISYENKNGKIVAYIFNDEFDGIGFTDNIIVGGTDPNSQNDGDGPLIEIYFDNISNESSFLVNPDFNLLVKLSDETGLNTTGSGVGHKLEGILNEKEDNPIDFSSYFIGDLDAGGKSGLINYRFSSMEPGDYSIKIKAWDVFNNPSITESYFTVVDEDGLVVRDVYNYPNPFSSFTTFTFQHNLNTAIDVKIKIYTIAGRLIKEIERSNLFDKFVRIDWDGRDEDRNEIANGTYLYKLMVNTVDGEYTENILGKLAIIK